MRLRNALANRTARGGPVDRLVRLLALRGFTAFDALMLPFLILFATIMVTTPHDALNASPVYGKLNDIAPIQVWAAALSVLAALIILAIVFQWWMLAQVSYVLISAWWFAITGLVYLAATTLLSPSVYALIGIACLYRQAEIAVGYGHGGE